MKRLKSIIILLTISVTLWGQANTNYSIFLQNRNKLAFDLLSMLENKNQNDIFSPYFLNYSFSELYLATKGNTSRQIGAFSYFSDDKLIHENNMIDFQKILKNNDNKNTNFNYSINIFIDDSSNILNDYQLLLKKFISDSVININFDDDSAKITNSINNIIKSNTNNTIKKAFEKEMIIRKPSIIVTSCVSFSGHWANNFLEYIYSPFYSGLPNNSNKKIKYLTTNDYFKYSESPDYQIIDIPYNGYKLDLLIILPKNDSTLDNIFTYFNYSSFLMWQRYMLQTQRVRLILPQISIEKKYDIKKSIKKITPFMFLKGGNFLNMIKEVVYITHFTHTAKFSFVSDSLIETEIKSIDFEKEIATKGSYIFNANHPFIFVLIDKKTQSILFIGKYTNS